MKVLILWKPWELSVIEWRQALLLNSVLALGVKEPGAGAVSRKLRKYDQHQRI